MEQDGQLRLRIVKPDKKYLDEMVEVRLTHTELSDNKTIKAVAGQDLVVKGLYSVPRGLYRLEVTANGFHIHSQFVTIPASGEAHVDVTFGTNSNQALDVVSGRAEISMKRVQHVRKGGFDFIRIPGFADSGRPGEPSLPQQVQYVILPAGGTVQKLEVTPGNPVVLPGKMKLIPVQPPIPDIPSPPEKGKRPPPIHPSPFVPPNPAIYQGGKPFPQSFAEIERVERFGLIDVAFVRIFPARFDPNSQQVTLFPDLEFRVVFNIDNARKTANSRQEGANPHDVAFIDSFTRRDGVRVAPNLFLPPIQANVTAPHIILTDNFQWPEQVFLNDGSGDKRPPTISERGAPLDGNVVAEFERLAEWRTARGMRSRVVTITQIVSGEFGDFTEAGFARDLAEVIRNFLKFAHQHWGTRFTLLAGDIGIVPMRKLVGSGLHGSFGVARIDDNPPPRWRCHVDREHQNVKLYPEFAAEPNEPLCAFSTGLVIPYDRNAGSGRLGWYCTTQEDFETRQEGFTRLPRATTSQFVIVEGPLAVIDDDFYWVRYVNSIPSDLYYSSIRGDSYGRPGFHDFDSNNNGLYGQSNPANDVLDRISFTPDISVGRAAVRSSSDARGFVGKTIAYEKLEYGARPVSPDYLRKLIFGSDYFGYAVHVGRQVDTTVPPGENQYTHLDATPETRVNISVGIALAMGTPNYRIISESPTRPEIPYRTDASASNPGWHFTTDNTYRTVSTTPTRFIRILGSEPAINPLHFLFDPVWTEDATAEKEALRTKMNTWYSTLNNVDRHYSDPFELSPPPSLNLLTEDGIRGAADQGCHFLSLSGHGWFGGCTGFNVVSRPDFSNEGRYFIAFADSCYTAEPEHRSLANVSTLDPDGGAVGYVGNTRYGWTGVGPHFEQFFWCALQGGSLGNAANLRMATGGVRSVWTRYAQNLFGDPGLTVWTNLPVVLDVALPDHIAPGETLTVNVRLRSRPATNISVTILGGWTNSSIAPPIYATAITDSEGRVSFPIPRLARTASLQVTVTSLNCKPSVHIVAIR